MASRRDHRFGHVGDSLLAVGFLGSGVALITAILAGSPLPLMLGFLGVLVATAVSGRWLTASPLDRARLRKNVTTGLIAGVCGLAAYDLSRYVLVQLFDLRLKPFGAWPHFGELLVGSTAPHSLLLAAGFTYHVLNGISFAVAYCFAVGPRRWQWGIVWAMGLEAMMLAIYPGWLDLAAVMREFVAVSVLGHVAYGSAIGLIAQRRLGSRR